MGASITITRRLDWADTDAAGYWHHSTVWTYAEAGEAALMRELGLTEMTFGHTPRKSLRAEFHRPIYFDDEVTIALTVESVGRTSATYVVELTVAGEPAATAAMTVVLIGTDGRPAPWPDEARTLLTG